jgi:hypothetical protein
MSSDAAKISEDTSRPGDDSGVALGSEISALGDSVDDELTDGDQSGFILDAKPQMRKAKGTVSEQRMKIA